MSFTGLFFGAFRAVLANRHSDYLIHHAEIASCYRFHDNATGFNCFRANLRLLAVRLICNCDIIPTVIPFENLIGAAANTFDAEIRNVRPDETNRYWPVNGKNRVVAASLKSRCTRPNSYVSNGVLGGAGALVDCRNISFVGGNR